MDRLPGEDLNSVYTQLTLQQKQALANELINIQNTVATLPRANGYGYARSYNDPLLHPKWIDFLIDKLSKSQENINKTAIVDKNATDQVK